MIPRMWRPVYIAYRVAEMAVSLFSRFLNATLFNGSIFTIGNTYTVVVT